MSSERIDRREALLGMLACSSAGALWLLGSPGQAATHPGAALSGGRWRIVPGERVGDIALGMSEQEVVHLLGETEERLDHKGFDLELVRRVLADGGVAEADLPTQVPGPALHLSYHSLGISVTLKDDAATGIFAFTGVQAGYEDDDWAPYRGDFENESLSLVSKVDDVLSAFGMPDDRLDSESPPIPESNLYYESGISFMFRQDTKVLSRICVNPATRTSSE